jgi:hypothetical protein
MSESTTDREGGKNPGAIEMVKVKVKVKVKVWGRDRAHEH